MTQDPLERFEDVIVDELCAYQAWLDSTDPTGTASRSGLENADLLRAWSPGPGESDSVVTAELRRSLDEFRHCLDVLHQVRIQAESDSGKSAQTVVATPSANVVGSTPGNSPGAHDWSVKGLADSGLPSRIGRFQIRRRLGIGGFGIVFLGFDPVARRERAIKIPRPELLGSLRLMERFQREVAAVAPLDHPNIVPVLESSFYGVSPYIVMPYVSDMTLAGWRAGQSDISPRDAAEIVRQLADGMAHAHERGVLHRDVKPGNVLLAPRPSKALEGSKAANGTEVDELPFVPRLTDFGMAKQAATEISEELHQTRTGTVIGTICYMSPEQAEGRNKDITARSDVYGLGATLFELLTGAPPYRGDTDLQTLQNISRNEPLTLQGPGIKPIPQDLQVICLKALEKDPRKRFDSAAEFSGELDRYLRGLPIHSRPILPLERCWRWARRRPGMAGMSALGILAVIAIAALIAENRVAHLRNQAKYTLDLEKLNQELKKTAALAKEQQSIAEASERRAKDGLYAYEINRAAVAWKQEDTREMFELLDRHIPGPGEVDRRGFEWWYLRRQASLAKRVLLEVGSPVYVLQFSPDRRVLASGGKDSIVRLFDPETGVVHQQIPTGQIEVNGLAFSPDGQELATSGDDGTIRIWNVATGDERLKIKTPFPKAFELAYSPDGTRIVSCGDSPTIHILDSQSGEELFTLEGHSRGIEHIDFTSDGESLVTTSHDESIRFWNLNNRERDHKIDAIGKIEPFIYVEDRQLLIAGNTSGLLQLIDVQQNRQVDSEKHLDRIHALKLHPHQPLLAIGDESGKIRLRRIGPNNRLADDQYLPWQAHRGKISSMTWTPDGSRLISTGKDGQVLSWSLTTILRAEPPRIRLDKNDDSSWLPWEARLQRSTPARGVLLRWDVHEQNPTLRCYTYRCGAFAMSRGGQYMGINYADNTDINLFSISDSYSRPVHEYPDAVWSPPGPPFELVFSPDEKMLLATYRESFVGEPEQRRCSILTLPAFERILPIPFSLGCRAIFSHDSKHLVLFLTRELIFWSILEQKVAWRVPEKTILQLACSPDNTLIATALSDRRIVIRNSHDGSIKLELTHHRELLQCMTFTPDSQTLVTVTLNGRLKLSHIATGQELIDIELKSEIHRTSIVEGGAYAQLHFSEDGHRLFCHLQDNDGPRDTPDEILVFDASDSAIENK